MSEPLKCVGCLRGLSVMMLDEDGTKIEVSGRPGVPSHAVDDYWFACTRWQLISMFPARVSALVEQWRAKGDGYSAIRFEDAADELTQALREVEPQETDITDHLLIVPLRRKQMARW